MLRGLCGFESMIAKKSVFSPFTYLSQLGEQLKDHTDASGTRCRGNQSLL